jgi:hypothetical protein
LSQYPWISHMQMAYASRRLWMQLCSFGAFTYYTALCVHDGHITESFCEPPNLEIEHVIPQKLGGKLADSDR